MCFIKNALIAFFAFVFFVLFVVKNGF